MENENAIASSRWASGSLLDASLLLFAVSALFSVTAVQAALLLTLVFLLLKKRSEGTLGALPAAALKHPLFPAWAVYLAVCLAAALAAYYPAKGFGQLNSDLLKFLCLFTLIFAVEARQAPRLAGAFTGAAGLAALGALAEVAWAALHGISPLPRANGVMNAVRFSELMTIALALITAMLALPKKDAFPRERLLYKLAAAPVFIALALSQTRSAYLAVPVLLAAAFVFVPRARLKLGALAMLLLIGAGVITAVTPSVRARVAAMLHPDRTTTDVNSASTAINIRLELWQLGWTMIKKHPALGVGPDNVKKVFADFHPEPVGYEKTWGSLHSLYIHQAAERGLAGLGALLLLFWSFFAFARRRFRDTGSPYALWALCALPAYYVLNLTEISFQHVHTSFAIFLSIALAAAAEKETV